MPDPVYTLGIEFVTGSFTNVSTRVERASWDSAIVDMIRSPRAGHALFELNNEDRQMSPRTNSDLIPGKAVRLTATHGGSEYALFFGRVLEVSLASALGTRRTLIEARDEWDRVNRLNYNTEMLVDIKPASLFTVLMSESMVQSFASDAIDDTIPFAWFRDRDAPTVLHDLVQSGNYQLTIDGNGTFRLRDRFWSFFSTAVATYTEADDTRYALAQDSIINRTKMRADVRRQSTDATTIAFLSQVIEIASGSSFGFWLTYQDPNEPSEATPVGSIIAQVASQDYYAAPSSDGTGNAITSQVSVQLTSFAASAVTSIYNAGPETAYITRFQVRGYPLSRLPDVNGQYDVASSQTTHGLRLLSVDRALFQNLSFLEGISKVITVERHKGREQNKLTLTNEFPDVLDNVNGDVLSMVDSFTSYVTQWQIRGVSHELSLVNGTRHSVTYDLETFDNFPFLVLDHATFGQLDNGRVLAV